MPRAFLLRRIEHGELGTGLGIRRQRCLEPGNEEAKADPPEQGKCNHGVAMDRPR